MERKCKNCSTHDDFTGACFCAESQHRADFTSGEFVCQCHSWNSDTIKQAFSIVREAILADEDIRKGFSDSIRMVIVESGIFYSQENERELAEQILQRIVGVEDED